MTLLAVAGTEPDPIQQRAGVMPFFLQAAQNGDGARGQSRGDIGLEAGCPDPQVFRDRPLGQLSGNGFVIGSKAVDDPKAPSVGAVDPELIGWQAQFPGMEDRPGVHDAQAKAPDLLAP